MIKQSYAEHKQIYLNFAVPGTLFVITAIVLITILRIVNGGLPTDITLTDGLILALASFRMIRGGTFDKLTRYLREIFKYQKRFVTEDGKLYVIKTETPNGTWRRAINETIECVWCLGFWTTLISLFLYYISPATYIIILLFAVSGVATAVQLLVSLIATKYEEIDMKNDMTETEMKHK